MADLAHSPTLAAHPVTAGGERLAAGVCAGEYVIDRFIGAGAMGEVYEGRQPVIGKRVAIKVLRRELAASEEAATRFIREAQAVNQIDHPNVVDIFAFGRLDDGRLYLVMDFVSGRSLRDVVGDGPLELGTALEILAAIADALDAAHARGVVHRDLKPDNIVLSDRSKVFVLDFGIAKLVSTVADGTAAPGTLTGQGTWMGTPGYMAPEQWSVDGAGTASDRYAFGVIAFELLCGKLPFSAASVPAMMEQHFRANVPALSARGVIAPAGVDDVLKRAMAKDPAARFTTARDMVDALRAVAGTGRGPKAAVVAPGRDRELLVPAIAGGGVLALAVIAFLAVRGGYRSNESPIDRAVDPAAAGPNGKPAGTVRIDVMSTPPGAEVRQGDRLVGKTPVPLYLKPGTQTNIVVRLPGYLPEPRTLSAAPSDGVEQVQLVAATQFEGVWQLANGELRAFERQADQVDVSKLETVAGAKQFYRHYAFVAVDQGVAFAGDDEIVDERAPQDPRCHIPVHIEYRYTPATDTLELRRDTVEIDLAVRCVVRARKLDTSRLVRVDMPHETREFPAPAGVPSIGKSRRKASKILPLDPRAAVQHKLDAAAKAKTQAKAVPQNAAAQPFNTVGNQPTSPYTTTKNQPTTNLFQGDSQQAGNPPSPQVPPQQQATLPNQRTVKN